MPRGKKSRGGGKKPNKPQPQGGKQQPQHGGKEKIGGVDAQKLMQSMLGSGGNDSANASTALLQGGGGGSEMFAKRAAESRNTSLSSATLEQLTPAQLDVLWERFNAPEARDDDSFEIWPDVAEAKEKKVSEKQESAFDTSPENATSKETENATSKETEKATTKETENTTTKETERATVSDANDDDDDNDAIEKEESKQVLAYNSEEDETLEDIVYPTTLMPAVSERSMDDILGVPTSQDGAPSLLARILDPDSGGKGKNKTGLHGLIAQPKKTMSAREKMRQKIRAQQRQRSGMTPDQFVYDKRGRRVPGARQVTEEDMRSGTVRSSQVDRSATRDAIRANIDKMRAQMAAEKQAKQQQREKDEQE